MTTVPFRSPLDVARLRMRWGSWGSGNFRLLGLGPGPAHFFKTSLPLNLPIPGKMGEIYQWFWICASILVAIWRVWHDSLASSSASRTSTLKQYVKVGRNPWNSTVCTADLGLWIWIIHRMGDGPSRFPVQSQSCGLNMSDQNLLRLIIFHNPSKMCTETRFQVFNGVCSQFMYIYAIYVTNMSYSKPSVN